LWELLKKYFEEQQQRASPDVNDMRALGDVPLEVPRRRVVVHGVEGVLGVFGLNHY
jgi:hypothetical protein